MIKLISKFFFLVQPKLSSPLVRKVQRDNRHR